jgi:hypothetical protein
MIRIQNILVPVDFSDASEESGELWRVIRAVPVLSLPRWIAA